MADKKTHPIVCFGEVLWDILPTGAVPGGAPMNVAYHVHKQGKDPALITSIGIDEEGKKLLDIFHEFNVCTDFFQIDREHRTGIVYAKPNEQHEVVYDIVKPVAWDFIERKEEQTALVSNAHYFVFGSLAARSERSRKTLFSLLELAQNKVLDINLRAPHFDQQIVEELMKKATLVKMNEHELELISGWYAGHKNLEDQVKCIRDQFNIEKLIVTMGGDGALLLFNDEFFKHKGYKVEVADTVGSGDAFLAGLLSKLLDHASAETALDFASRMGAFIATRRGACPEYDLEDVENIFKPAKH